MDVFRMILAGLFIFMSLGIARQAWYVRRLGLFFGAVVYAGSGILAFTLAAWWPLFVGFAGAWILRYMGADPPTDLRFDLPKLNRVDVNDKERLDEYLKKWVATDPQIALVISRFVNEAWELGYRKPSHMPNAPEWSAITAVGAWHQMIASDLRLVALANKRTTMRYLDQIDELSSQTLMAAGNATARYNLHATPSNFAEVEEKIQEPRDLAEYASAYVADTLLAGRLRVLAWTFQQWYGERYELPHKRGASSN